MYRNAENRFANIPQLDAPRSVFNMSKKHLTSFNTGQLIPFYNKLCYPGDTVNIKTNYVVRTTTPIKAPMDMAYIDTYYFFVPLRLVWEHFKEFMGENKLTPWEQPTQYTIPQITPPAGGWKAKSLAVHLGAQPGIENYSWTALKLRAYALIYNDWFRDQNLQNGLMVNLDDATQVGSNGSNFTTDVQLGGKPANVCKFHDYFTSCLPEPQKGPDIYMPLGTTAPIQLSGNTNAAIAKKAYDSNLSNITSGNISVQGQGRLYTGDNQLYIDPNGTLEANLEQASSALVTDVRRVFAIQQLYELDARAGTRYTEIIEAHFGVRTSDARLQRTEYLGGQRQPMNVSQVVQTSETTQTSAQGNIAGYSLTIDSHDDVNFAVEEHGYILGLTCVRTNHTYQQGIAREDSYKERLEFYWPTLDNIGEQGVKNKEIYLQEDTVLNEDGSPVNEDIFGYQERYAEARCDVNTLAGEFRDDYAQSLKVWQYADNYNQLPTLSDGWIQETPVNMDKTLQVTSEVADQIQGDFFIDAKYIRRMAMYAIPGLTRM